MAEEANPETVPDIDPLRPSLPARAIMAIVAAEYRMPLRSLISTQRAQAIVIPRQTAMWLVSRHTVSSLPQIGQHFGGFDHTTVLHALRRVDEWRESDPEYANRLRRIEAEINAAEAALNRAGSSLAPVREAAPPPLTPPPAELPVAVRAVMPAVPWERRVARAAGTYLTARTELQACQWGKGERAANEKVARAFGALAAAYRGDESGRPA